QLESLELGHVEEHPNFLHLRGKLLHYFACCLGINITRTLFVEHEPEGIRAGFYSQLGILETRGSADFDPGHRNVCSPGTQARSPLALAIKCWVRNNELRLRAATRLRLPRPPLSANCLIHVLVTPPSSTTHLSERRGSRRLSAWQCPARNGCRFRP